MRNSYNTKQKEAILELLKEENHDFSIKELYEHLNKKIGLTTIYRYIEKLESEDKIKKSIYDGVVKYSYLGDCDCSNHFYLKCSSCGRLIHIDCDCINDFSKHIHNNHKFKISMNNIVINGLCFECEGSK